MHSLDLPWHKSEIIHQESRLRYTIPRKLFSSLQVKLTCVFSVQVVNIYFSMNCIDLFLHDFEQLCNKVTSL